MKKLIVLHLHHAVLSRTALLLLRRYLETKRFKATRCVPAIGVLARSVATPCKAASVTARAQALQRVQAIMVLEGKGSMMQAPTEPGSYIFELWRNYACFVCSATDKEDLGEIRNSKKKRKSR